MTEDVLSLVDEWGPEEVVCVSDRRSGMRGVLVLDDTARGMGKGGTRMSPTLTVREVARLARTMTWKWAAVDLFHGGAKAGILGDPRAADEEAVLRAFARALRNEVPAEYVFGLSGAMGRPVRVPEQVYAEQRAASLAASAAALGIRGGIAVDPEPAAPTPSAAGSR